MENDFKKSQENKKKTKEKEINQICEQEETEIQNLNSLFKKERYPLGEEMKKIYREQHLRISSEFQHVIFWVRDRYDTDLSESHKKKAQEIANLEEAAKSDLENLKGYWQFLRLRLGFYLFQDRRQP